MLWATAGRCMLARFPTPEDAGPQGVIPRSGSISILRHCSGGLLEWQTLGLQTQTLELDLTSTGDVHGEFEEHISRTWRN